MASPDINTEDFQAAVDYLSLREEVDADRIGLIGICGWGGLALNAAALDTRVRATVAATMYDKMCIRDRRSTASPRENSASPIRRRRLSQSARSKHSCKHLLPSER